MCLLQGRRYYEPSLSLPVLEAVQVLCMVTWWTCPLKNLTIGCIHTRHCPVWNSTLCCTLQKKWEPMVISPQLLFRVHLNDGRDNLRCFQSTLPYMGVWIELWSQPGPNCKYWGCLLWCRTDAKTGKLLVAEQRWNAPSWRVLFKGIVVFGY